MNRRACVGFGPLASGGLAFNHDFAKVTICAELPFLYVVASVKEGSDPTFAAVWPTGSNADEVVVRCGCANVRFQETFP